MPPIVSRIVEVCVFRMLHGKTEYLLLQRAPKEKIYPGIWQLVSGTIDSGERAIDAAVREFKEETSLKPKRFWVVPHVSTFYDRTNDTVNVCPFFAVEVDPNDVLTLSHEHQRYEWLPFDKALARLVWPGQRTGLGIVENYIVGGGQASELTLVNLP
jgi:dATP pyrophosphohydrolase